MGDSRVETPGRRLFPPRPPGFGVHLCEVGDYFLGDDGWYGRAPNGLPVCLKGHRVVEHLDGKITVTPSIAVDNGEGGCRWHGHLQNGVWRECRLAP